MKQVIIINKENLQIVDADAVSPHNYYGVVYAGSKGFVVRDAYQAGNYRVRCASAVTKGNMWDRHENDSLSELIKIFLGQNYQVFEFDTYQKLFHWLASNE